MIVKIVTLNWVLLISLVFVPHFSLNAAEIKPVGEGLGNTSITLENSLNLRDPFRRLRIQKESTDSELAEIEKIPLEKFRLTGVIAGTKKHKALFTGPDGKMYILGEKSKIGVKSGYIKKISPGFVYVVEKITNILGKDELFETVFEYSEKKSISSQKEVSVVSGASGKGSL